MATARGRTEVKRLIASLPAQIEKRLLPGAARAGANVIAEEARDQCIDKEVAASLKVRTKAEPGLVVARIKPDPKMPGAFRATWIEYGTDPHFITVDQAASGGRTARRINYLDAKAGAEGRAGPGATLVINGKPVGTTVLHPGARPFPFLRPALDTKRAAAVTAAQAYVDKHVTRSGIAPVPDAEEDA
jgi:hypothetical protein